MIFNKLSEECRKILYKQCHLMELFNLGKTFPEFIKEILDECISIQWVDFKCYTMVDGIIDPGRGGVFERVDDPKIEKYWSHRYFWWKSVIEGSIEWMKELIKIGYSPNDWFWYSSPALLNTKWEIQTINEMLKLQFPVDNYSIYGVTPIIKAVQCNTPHILELLLLENPNLEIRQVDGNWKSTALVQAVRLGNIECVELLLSVGSKFHRSLQDSVIFNRIDILELLIEYGANINKRDEFGWTALHYSVYFDKYDFTKVLVRAGANIHVKDNNNKSPYEISKIKKTKSIIKYFEMVSDFIPKIPH